jgi:hypothetical protein
MNVDDDEINRSFNSRSSSSNYSLKGKNVEKIRKNNYNDIAFPVETEIDLKKEVINPSSLKSSSDYLEHVSLKDRQWCDLHQRAHRVYKLRPKTQNSLERRPPNDKRYFKSSSSTFQTFHPPIYNFAFGKILMKMIQTIIKLFWFRSVICSFSNFIKTLRKPTVAAIFGKKAAL